MMCAAGFMLVGNWVRYAGSSKATSSGGVFACAMFGTILCGFSQPFVLAAPTRYSDLWFTNKGRVAATAVMSLANPLGGALAQLINPLWVTKEADVSHMTLYVSIMVSLYAATLTFKRRILTYCRLLSPVSLHSSSRPTRHLLLVPPPKHQKHPFGTPSRQCSTPERSFWSCSHFPYTSAFSIPSPPFSTK